MPVQNGNRNGISSSRSVSRSSSRSAKRSTTIVFAVTFVVFAAQRSKSHCDAQQSNTVRSAPLLPLASPPGPCGAPVHAAERVRDRWEHTVTQHVAHQGGVAAHITRVSSTRGQQHNGRMDRLARPTAAIERAAIGSAPHSARVSSTYSQKLSLGLERSGVSLHL